MGKLLEKQEANVEWEAVRAERVGGREREREREGGREGGRERERVNVVGGGVGVIGIRGNICMTSSVASLPY